jgi:hypothetical protein
MAAAFRLGRSHAHLPVAAQDEDEGCDQRDAPDAGGRGDRREHAAALRHLNEAVSHWKNYAAIRDANDVPTLYNRLGYVDITAITKQVATDIEIAKGWKPGCLKDSDKRAGGRKRLSQVSLSITKSYCHHETPPCIHHPPDCLAHSLR